MLQNYTKKVGFPIGETNNIINAHTQRLELNPNSSQALKNIPHNPSLINTDKQQGIFKGFPHSSIQKVISYLGYEAAISLTFEFSKINDFKNCKLVRSCINALGHIPCPQAEPMQVITATPTAKLTQSIPTVNHQNEPSKSLTLSIGECKYLYDIYLKRPELRQFIYNEKSILLKAPTGIGKTYFSVRIGIESFEKTGIPTIITFPLNGIVDQQGIKAQKERLNIPYITASTKDQLNEIDKNTPVIFCNYDSVKIVQDKVLKHHNKYDIIVDEQHLLINDTGFRKKVIDNLQSVIDSAKSKILMSATPVNIGLDHYAKIKIEAPKKDIKQGVIYTKNIIKSAINQVVRNLLNIILINNKKQITKMAKALKKMGFRVATIYSDGNKDNPTYQYLMENEKLPEGIDVLICTSKIATGINIIHTGIDQITKKQRLVRLIYCETTLENGYLTAFNKRLKVQFMSRPRNTGLIEQLIVIASEQLRNKRKQDVLTANEYFIYLKEKFTKLAHENNNNILLELLTNKEFSETLSSNVLQIYTVENGTIKVNENVVRYEALQHEIKHATIELPEIIETEILEEIEQNLKVATTEVKEEREKILSQFFEKCEQIEQNNEFLAIVKTIMENSNDKKLYELIDQNFGSEIKELDSLPLSHQEISEYTSLIKTICKFRNEGLSITHAISLITKSNKKLKGREKIKLILDTLKNQNNKLIPISKLGTLEKLQIKQDKAMVKSLISSFKQNDGILTSDQITNEIKYRLEKIKGIPYLDLSNRKAANIAQSFLHIEKEIIKIKGKKITRYKFTNQWTLDNFKEYHQIKLSKQKMLIPI